MRPDRDLPLPRLRQQNLKRIRNDFAQVEVLQFRFASWLEQFPEMPNDPCRMPIGVPNVGEKFYRLSDFRWVSLE
jgi:hypothetical protein